MASAGTMLARTSCSSRPIAATGICIVGAGASGLAVAKNFVARGIPFDCLEREQDIGGLWNFATASGIVYETTHLVSSISSTGFDDLPMLDEDYPEYPSHERVLGYFRDCRAQLRARAAHRVRQGGERDRAAARRQLWEVAVAGEDCTAPLSRRGDCERPPRRAAHADLSRHLRRRDHALAPLQEPQAGARQARAGGGLRQLGGGHRLGCRARRLARCSSASAAATGSCRSSSSASPPATSSPTRRDAAAAAAHEALAVPGQRCGCCRARLALPHARPRLLHRPGAPDHDGRDSRASSRTARSRSSRRSRATKAIAFCSRMARRRRSTPSCSPPATSRSSRSSTTAWCSTPPGVRVFCSMRCTPSTKGCSPPALRRPTAACGGWPTTRAQLIANLIVARRARPEQGTPDARVACRAGRRSARPQLRRLRPPPPRGELLRLPAPAETPHAPVRPRADHEADTRAGVVNCGAPVPQAAE